MLKITEVIHPTLKSVCVLEEDIARFGVPLARVEKTTLHCDGHSYSFSPNTRYQRLDIDGIPQSSVCDVVALKKAIETWQAANQNQQR